MVESAVVIVLIVVIGVSVLAYRNRSEKGIESGISSFRRELRALAPESKDGPRRPGPPPEWPRPPLPSDSDPGAGDDDEADAGADGDAGSRTD